MWIIIKIWVFLLFLCNVFIDHYKLNWSRNLFHKASFTLPHLFQINIKIKQKKYQFWIWCSVNDFWQNQIPSRGSCQNVLQPQPTIMPTTVSTIKNNVVELLLHSELPTIIAKNSYVVSLSQSCKQKTLQYLYHGTGSFQTYQKLWL